MSVMGKIIDLCIHSGVTTSMTESDARYVRFLNAILLLFTLTQIPVFPILIMTKMTSALTVNVIALSLIILSFYLNRRGLYLSAKLLVTGVILANTLYFVLLVGSGAPAHFWLIPCAMLATLVFKPHERIWRLFFVVISLVSFMALEYIYLDLEPVLVISEDPATQIYAAHGSTVSAIILTLILAGLMHARFAHSEVALSMKQVESERLLRAILPDEIARALKKDGSAPAVRHDDVSLLFADIVGFTPLSASMPAEEVVALLAEIFQRFDKLIEESGVEKIKTIGDAYMIAGGVPNADPDHAERLGRCALGMLDALKAFCDSSEYDLQLRIGLHRGPAVAGVIGTTKFAYDLWGESVNLASRLESSSEPGRIQVSEAYRSELEAKMTFVERGEVTLKGVGKTKTYWLTALK